MKFIKIMLFMMVLIATSHLEVKAQQAVTIKVISQEKPQPFYSHLGLIDRKVNFLLKNEGDKPIIVYGTKYEGKLQPGGYFLKFDSDSKEWKYPTRDNKPLKWKKRSAQKKEILIIYPKESLGFDSLFSSETDTQYRYKITVYVSLKRNSEPIEIISEEFSILK